MGWEKIEQKQQQDTWINELKMVEAILQKPENAEKLKNNFGNNLEKDLTSKAWLFKIQALSKSLNLINQSSLTDQADKEWLNSLKTFLDKCLNSNEAVKDINKKLVNNLKKLDNGVRGVDIDESKISMKNVSLDWDNLGFEYTLDWNNSIKLKTDNDWKISLIESGNLNIAWKYYKIDLDAQNTDRPLKLSEDKDGFLNVLKTYNSDKNFDISSKDGWSWYNITFTLDEWYKKTDFTTRTQLNFNQPLTINPNFSVSKLNLNPNPTLSWTNPVWTDYGRILESVPQKISFELDANWKFNWFDNREKDWYKVSVDHLQKKFKIDKVESSTTQKVILTKKNVISNKFVTTEIISPWTAVKSSAEDGADGTENPAKFTKGSVIDKITDSALKNWNEKNSNSKLEEIIGLLWEVDSDTSDIKTKKTELSALLADWNLTEFQKKVWIQENEKWKDWSSKVDGKLGTYTLQKTQEFLNAVAIFTKTTTQTSEQKANQTWSNWNKENINVNDILNWNYLNVNKSNVNLEDLFDALLKLWNEKEYWVDFTSWKLKEWEKTRFNDSQRPASYYVKGWKLHILVEEKSNNLHYITDREYDKDTKRRKEIEKKYITDYTPTPYVAEASTTYVAKPSVPPIISQ